MVADGLADVVGALYTFSFDIGAFGAGTNDITATVGGVSQTFTVTADNNNDTTFHTNGFSFVGTSENALRIQIWTALIAMLLLKWLHHLSKAKWSLSNLASMLRLNLFTYRNLRAWLDDPFETQPYFRHPNS